MRMTVEELRAKLESDPSSPEVAAPEKKTTLLLTEGNSKPITRILPRNQTHNIGATPPMFGYTQGVHVYDVFGTPLHVVVEPDGTCHYAPLFAQPMRFRPDAHLGAVTGDC